MVIMLVLGACTMEKRVHMSGYHTEWYKSNHNADRQELAKNGTAAKSKKNQIAIVSQAVTATNALDNSTTVNDILTASVDNSVAALPSRKTVSFRKKENVSAAKTDPTTEKKNVIANKVSKQQKKADTDNSTAAPEGKSQLVALLICIFIGVLGIHRFYLGYTGIGVLMLLTLGLCGILALIDLIRIITGDLKPKGGDYSEKL